MKTFDLVDGVSLAGLPRFSIGSHSVLFGPYDSAQAHDGHFAETLGSGDPVFDSVNEVRFSKKNGLLVSCRLGVPENPMSGNEFLSAVNKLPIRRALPRIATDAAFYFPPATQTEIDSDGTELGVFLGQAGQVKERIQVGTDFEILLGEDLICGFLLHNPADYLVWGWPLAAPRASDQALAVMLATYLRAINSDFVDRLEDADSEACERLSLFRASADQLAHSPQRDVLIKTIASVQDIFCADDSR